MKNRSGISGSLLYAIAVFAVATAGSNNLRASDNGYIVEGTYAVHSKIGEVGTGIGIYKVDSDGTFTGYAELNLPGTGGTRTLVHVTVSGTLTVNPDGVGVVKYTASGPFPAFQEDFVITRAENRGDKKLALKIFDQRREASFLLGTGYEVTIVWNRLPEDPDEH